MKPLLMPFLLLLLFAVCTVASPCLWDSDCSGYKADAFCASERCIDGVCKVGPSPCSALCSETLRQCVECETNADCKDDPKRGVCDPRTHTCRTCRDHRDCPRGTWCTGGHWYCISDECRPPPVNFWPCQGRTEICVEEERACTRCHKDEDCGGTGRPYDFCTNRVKCNLTSLTCYKEDALPENCRFCDSARQVCAECMTDDDCDDSDADLRQPFCSPPTEQSACRSGRCTRIPSTESTRAAWKAPCSGQALDACCDESAKRCTHCPAEPIAPVLSAAPNNEEKNLLVPSVSAPSPCEKHADCANGWLCLVASPFDKRVRFCRPCRNDAQCLVNGGRGVCNKTSGGCSEAVPDVATASINIRDLGAIDIEKPRVSPVDVRESHSSLRIREEETLTYQSVIAIVAVVIVSIVFIIGILCIVPTPCCRCRQRPKMAKRCCRNKRKKNTKKAAKKQEEQQESSEGDGASVSTDDAGSSDDNASAGEASDADEEAGNAAPSSEGTSTSVLNDAVQSNAIFSYRKRTVAAAAKDALSSF